MLFVRGLGLGASIQPTTAAAYAVVDSSQVPRATAALNTLRQIGASVGTALLSAVLQHESAIALSPPSGAAEGLLGPLSAGERAQLSGPLATAFGHTFIWAAATHSWPSFLPSLSCAPSAPAGGPTPSAKGGGMGNAAVEVAANAGDGRAG